MGIWRCGGSVRGNWSTFAIICALGLLLSCGGDTTAPQPPPPPPPPAAVPTTISVTPSTSTLSSFAETASLSAEVRDQRNVVMSGVTVTWSSSNAGVVSVTGNGEARSVADGSATITARAGNVSGTAVLTVDRKAASLTIIPASALLSAVGDTVRLSAQGMDANGHAVEDIEIEWSSGNGESSWTVRTTAESPSCAMF